MIDGWCEFVLNKFEARFGELRVKTVMLFVALVVVEATET
jgi:hypothetical protein